MYYSFIIVAFTLVNCSGPSADKHFQSFTFFSLCWQVNVFIVKQINKGNLIMAKQTFFIFIFCFTWPQNRRPDEPLQWLSEISVPFLLKWCPPRSASLLYLCNCLPGDVESSRLQIQQNGLAILGFAAPLSHCPPGEEGTFLGLKPRLWRFPTVWNRVFYSNTLKS